MEKEFEKYWNDNWRKFNAKLRKANIKLPIGVKKYKYNEDGSSTARLDWSLFQYNSNNLTYSRFGKVYPEEILEEYDYLLSITVGVLTEDAKEVLAI